MDLKERAYAIHCEIYEIPQDIERKHVGLRRKKRMELLKTVAPEDRWMVEEYLNQFGRYSSVRQRCIRNARNWTLK